MGADLLIDYDTTAGNTDVVQFGPGVSADQLWFSRSESNLRVSIIGTSNSLTLQNWYLSSAYQTERFVTDTGLALASSRVNQLVSAMTAFAPPPWGATTLDPTLAAAMQPVLGEAWLI